MFGKKIKLFNLFGFTVHIDLSWIFIAVLITWSLAKGVFPNEYENLGNTVHWYMGAVGALGLFLSIIFHELSHSLVARRFGLPIEGITLFIFGGVAEMHDEPETPKAEFFMAIAGPIASIIIGLFFLGVRFVGETSGWTTPVTGVVNYLAIINFILAGFNLLPAFPLDGGRVLRSGLWKWKNNIRKATRQASAIGKGFGTLLIVLGVLQFIAGGIVGGIWWFLIGMFMRNASQMSYQQLLVRKELEGESIERFMNDDPVTISPDTTIHDLVDNYVYKHHFKMYPVVKDHQLVGCISTKEIKSIDRDRWDNTTVSDIVSKCSADNTIDKNTDAMQAMSIMHKSDNSRLMVTEGDKLVGIIALKDLLRFLSLKVDLEGDEND
jgi:Zn-dependent protease